MAGKDNETKQEAPAAPDRGPAEVVLLLQVEGRRDRLQEHRRASPLHLREGQDPLAPDQRRLPPPPAPGRSRGQARPRDGAPAVRGRGPRRPRGRRPPRPRRSWRPRGALTMQVVLRQDVESLGLRGEVVNVARGYARNFLLPRGLAELATPGLVARARAARRAARAPRGADRRTRRRRSRSGSRRPSSASTSTPARPARCSARSPRRTSPTGSGKT